MKTKRKLAEVKKNAEVAAKLADLRAALKVTRGDLVTSGRRTGELEAEVAALEAERDELGAEVDKSNTSRFSGRVRLLREHDGLPQGASIRGRGLRGGDGRVRERRPAAPA